MRHTKSKSTISPPVVPQESRNFVSSTGSNICSFINQTFNEASMIYHVPALWLGPGDKVTNESIHALTVLTIKL